METPMKYTIRKARLEDCQELSKLKLKIWKQVYQGIYPASKIEGYDFKKNEEKFEKLIEKDTIELVVVEINHKLMGYMSYGEPIRKFREYRQEIGLLYLDQEYPKMGLGRKLFSIGYENIMKKEEEFFISCNKYNEKAKKFYEKMGGEIIHIDEDNPNDRSLPQIKFLYKKKK